MQRSIAAAVCASCVAPSAFVDERRPHDWFGMSLAVLGDVDGDGVADLAVASPAPPGGSAGPVVVLSGRTRDVLFSIEPPPGEPDFGAALCALGDVDGDRVRDFAVGSPTYEPGTYGSVRVYSGRDGALLQRVVGEAPADGFGLEVAPLGDVDGDGAVALLVGARDVVRVCSLGAAPRVLRSHAFAGFALAGGVDVDGGGAADYVLGAPEHGDAGAAFCFSGRTGESLVELVWPSDAPEALMALGERVLLVRTRRGATIAAIASQGGDPVLVTASAADGWRPRGTPLPLDEVTALVQLAGEPDGLVAVAGLRGFQRIVVLLDTDMRAIVRTDDLGLTQMADDTRRICALVPIEGGYAAGLAALYSPDRFGEIVAVRARTGRVAWRAGARDLAR